MYSYSFIEDVATGGTTELSQLVWASLPCMTVFQNGIPSLDAPAIPWYTTEAIQEMELELARVRAMSLEAADAEAHKAYDELCQWYQTSMQRHTLKRQRLLEMQQKVQAWDASEFRLWRDIKQMLLGALQESIALDEHRIEIVKKQYGELRCPTGETYRLRRSTELEHHLSTMRRLNHDRLKEHGHVMIGLRALEESLGPRLGGTLLAGEVPK